jgi:hypothetical protein
MLSDLAPPPEAAFPTCEDLSSQLQDHARARGCAVAVGRSKHEQGAIIRTKDGGSLQKTLAQALTLLSFS